MAFLSSWLLYGLGALAVPVAIHLWRQRRVVKIRFSTLRFLKLAAAKTSRSSRIENVLLLILRCLLIALLVLAVARPVVSTKAAKLLSGDVPRTVVLAIDNSMSMSCRVNGTTRLESAKAQAIAVLDDLKPGDDVAVIAAGSTLQWLVAEPTLDHRVARQMVESISQGESRSDFPAVFRAAVKIVARGTHGLRELYFFTDSQEAAWRFDAKAVFDSAWDQSELHPVIVRPDDLDIPNAAVAAVKISTPFASAGTPVSGTAVVENFSSRPLQEVLEIRFGGERVIQKPLDIAPGGSVEVSFEAPVPDIAGRWAEGVASIEGDNLPVDDRFYFALPIAQVPRVLIVEGQQAGDERLRSGYYLKMALVAGISNPIPPKMISSAQLEETSLEGVSAIFLTDVASLGDRSLVRLERYLQSGGTIAFFPGDLSTSDSLSHMDFLPAKPQGLLELPPGRLATLISDPSHPLFANAWDKGAPFPALPQKRLMQWKLRPEAKSLLTFSNGTPFVIFSQHGPGRVFIVNASADRTWGDFPLSPAFLPLVQQIARLSAEQAGGNVGRVVGEPLPMPPNLPLDQPLTLRAPDGSDSVIPAGEKAVISDRAAASGFYKVNTPTEISAQIYAVNADRHESNLRPIDPAALQKIVSADSIAGLGDLKLWLAKSRGVVPLWPALLLLALAVFAAEAVLANLLAGKRSQGDGGQIKTGRLNKRRIGVSFRPSEKEVSV